MFVNLALLSMMTNRGYKYIYVLFTLCIHIYIYTYVNQTFCYISIILPVLSVPSWALAIAYRLPLMFICSAIMGMGLGPGPGLKKGATPAAAGAASKPTARHPQIDTQYAMPKKGKIARAQAGINSKGNIIDI